MNKKRKVEVGTNNNTTIHKKSFLNKRTLFLREEMYKGMHYGKQSINGESENSEQKNFSNNISIVVNPSINTSYYGKKLYNKIVKEKHSVSLTRKNSNRGSCTSTSRKDEKIKYQNRRQNVKQARKEYDITKQRDKHKLEQNSYQASNVRSKLAFSMSKKQDEKNRKSLLKRLKTVLSEKFFSAKETVSSMKRAICLYALGIMVLVAIPVLLAVAILYNSPFALFLPNASGGETLPSVTRAYISEFNQEINELARNPLDCETGRIVYTNYEGDAISPSNYYDIIAVYMVRYGIGNMATIMNDATKENLKQVFQDMCTYETKVKSEKAEVDGQEVTQQVLLVKVSLKTYRDMIGIYNLSEVEINLLETLMSPEYLALLDPSSVGEGNDVSNEQIESVISSLTDNDIKAVLNFALSKLGYPYSQQYRDSGNYYDCSSLTYYSWLSIGVNLTYEGSNTAAQQAKLCNDKGYTVSYSEMQPGDLIFYSFGNNGRYKNISHVAMYCGDGMLVDASYSKQKVVYRKIYNKENIVLIGRPGKK